MMKRGSPSTNTLNGVLEICAIAICVAPSPPNSVTTVRRACRAAGAPGPSPNCSTLENACEAGVCLNGATCSLGIDHFNCTCAPGYKGTPPCFHLDVFMFA